MEDASFVNIGDRVGVFFSSTKKKVKLIGFGVYLGEEIPPPGVMFLGLDMHSKGWETAKIQLDSGEIVWGCEGWWGAEKYANLNLEGRVVEVVLIEDCRAGKVEIEQEEQAPPFKPKNVPQEPTDFLDIFE